MASNEADERSANTNPIAMNPVQQRIVERLAALPPELSVLKEFATRHARFCSSIAADDTLQIAHQPWVAPEGYALLLFPPAKKAWLANFKERTGRAIPAAYRDFLLAVNGCSAHELSLFGLPPSMHGATPKLDRSRQGPLDLGAANLHWARAYAVDPAEFHFGGRAWTSEENIAYFWSTAGLRAVRKSGAVAGEWPDLPSLLAAELPAAERRVAERTPAEWWH
jgi:hypothetical protein